MRCGWERAKGRKEEISGRGDNLGDTLFVYRYYKTLNKSDFFLNCRVLNVKLCVFGTVGGKGESGNFAGEGFRWLFFIVTIK